MRSQEKEKKIIIGERIDIGLSREISLWATGWFE